jgi:hypothetical protein
MIKKDKQKIAKDAAKIAAVKMAEHQKKSKKKSDWKSFLGSAVRTAVDIAPTLLPLFLGSHGPTMKLAQQNPMIASGAPLAIGTTQQLTGLKNYRVTKKDAHGSVTRVCVTTYDLVTSISSDAYSAGDVAYEAWISPLDPAFEGTKFAEFGQQYERWRVKKAAFVYQPTCPATLAGGFTACVFNDPEVDVNSLGGEELLRVAGSQSGSDSFQIWNSGCWHVPPTMGSDLFTDPDGTDVRFVIGGKVVLVASAAIAGGTSPGNLYFAAECEYEIPTLVEGSAVGASGFWRDSVGWSPSGDFYNALQTFSIDRGFLGEGAQLKLSAVWTESGVARTGNVLTGLSAGDWQITCKVDGTVITQPNGAILTDEAVSYGAVIFSDTGILDSPQTSSLSTTFISVPVGMPPNTPVVGFWGNAATISVASVWAAKVNEALFQTDPMSVANRLQRARNRLYARTNQGQQQIIAARTAELSRQLRLLQLAKMADDRARPAPRATGISSSSLSGATAKSRM